MRTLLTSLLLFLPLSASVTAQSGLAGESSEPPDLDRLLSVRERFVYNVRYGFLNLGEIEVELLPDTSHEGQKVLHMRTIMRSNSRNLFIGRKNVHYHSYFSYNESWPYSHLFWRNDLHDDELERTRIEFDREEQKVRFFERGEAGDTLHLEEPASGGDIIFYYSRMFAGTGEEFDFPVYVSGEMGSVNAVSSTQTERRSYDAFPEAIETYRAEGNADIDGPFGFSGRFRAWFAADDRRLPVEAHARIIFGNVRVTLISYEIVNE